MSVTAFVYDHLWFIFTVHNIYLLYYKIFNKITVQLKKVY